uniref:Uncharacterized protein n=1 Tax=Poecilia reticulata TaxID=8081 RepID=A0A3P9PNL4_POERE
MVCKELPQHQRDLINQSYHHSDKDDPKRIKMIIQRAVKDAEWILDKVRVAG